MNYILFDSFRRNNLLPLTYLRPVPDIRIGILTIREKWEIYLDSKTSSLTEDYLRKKYPIVQAEDNIMINGSVLPNRQLVDQILGLEQNQALVKNDVVIAMRVTSVDPHRKDDETGEEITEIQTDVDFQKVSNNWDIFSRNARALTEDYHLLTKGRKSQPVSSTNKILGKDIFLEEGARVECAILNAETGPIYIGKNAEVMEGAMIRGPFSLGEESVVKMGAKIYGATTIGPFCKVGGEVNNSVFFGYSNKAHDGFMGQSVIGEWCNIGADTNTSNLKNSYEEVKLWNFADRTFVETGLQFCGLIMGDHAKCGINVMFNTGTVVGVGTNIFGHGYQRNYIPGFLWGGNAGFRPYDFRKFLETARRVTERRQVEISAIEEEILDTVYQLIKERDRSV
jgi:UDP-N-acetylglucosamine diphosphorylase/glucosamine-1-phosphate N-acetyltransferase